MYTLAEIENAVGLLPPAQQAALFHFLAARLELKPSPRKVYRTMVHPGRTLPGVDPDKLGQLPENF